MYIDLFGKKRAKLGLHHHTTCSDGKLTPAEVTALYKAAGYDAIALTDHWFYTAAREEDGIRVLSGAEYHTGTMDGAAGVYHVLCLLAEREPAVEITNTVQEIIDAIHEAGGLAVLAHPAWSLNTPEKILKLRGVDATEIFNTVSERGMSRRGDSSLIVDMLACEGLHLPLTAADDSHFYGEGNMADSVTSFIMVECDDPHDDEALRRAIREKRFYASTGPEVHLSVKDGVAVVDCSPAAEIALLSNAVYSPGRVAVGEGLTHYEYQPAACETYVRARVTDSEGRCAWSNMVKL
jgi:histidinol phosphatase-like PHP family hydrolase